MTAPTTENQVQEQKLSDKELNFRNLEAKYQRELEKERAARIEAERIAQERQSNERDDDDDSDPYVDHKKLNKKLNVFGENIKRENKQSLQQIKEQAKEELKQEMWLENNPDFYETLQNHADKLAQQAPELAKTILRMPEGFERQKLVYQNIKTLKLDRPPEKQSSIQDKVDANRRSPYYQPSGVGTAPYSTSGDFSQGGQEQAYKKMQELKKTLRL